MRVTGLRSRTASGGTGHSGSESEREPAAAGRSVSVVRWLNAMTAPQKTALLAVLGICAAVIAVSLLSDPDQPRAEQKSNYAERQRHQVLRQELATNIAVLVDIQLGSEKIQRLAGQMANRQLYEELDAFQADSCQTNLVLVNRFTSSDGSKSWDLTCVGCTAISMFLLPESVASAADRGSTGQPAKIGLTKALSLVGICADPDL